MKRLHFTILLAIVFFMHSCKKEDSVSCVTCTSPETAEFVVCEESNGNASVNGQDTGTDFGTYISGLESAGASCGN